MKRIILLTLALAWATISASAVPILLNTTPLPGTQPANQGDQTVADWLDSLIPGGDQIGSGANVLVDPGDSAPSGYPTFGSGVTSILLPVGDYDYLVLHWGGSGGGVDYAYDLTQCLDGSSWTFRAEDGRNNGLSSYRFYNPNGTTQVPDASSSYVLLTIGLSSLAFMRRKLT